MKTVVFFILLQFLQENEASNIQEFPENFKFGVSTSAYQVEGAWNKDGKGESIWDTYVHSHPEEIQDGVETANSYDFYKRDVEMVRELGADFYRFSISWARVMPTGFPNVINEKGLEYYDNLIDELNTYSIEPVITMYDSDLPQNLQDLGGWANPNIIQWFEDYSKILFDRYAHKVKAWVTINNPKFCFEAYGDTPMPPAVGAKGIGDYICVKNVLMAHARAYRLFQKDYRTVMKHAQIGISVSVNWADPLNYNKTDANEEATELYRQFSFNMFLHPIFSKQGGYPKQVKDIVDKNSQNEGYPRSRLPELTRDEIEILKGSADFIGMNHYTTLFVQPANGSHFVRNIYKDIDVVLTQAPTWEKSSSDWLRSAPYGLYKACLYLNQHYSNPPILITEHGWSTDKCLNDKSRIKNMREYFKAAMYALQDGTDLRGLAIWSLMDSLQWKPGTTERFGLYEVDFESPAKTRTARNSAFFYKHVIHNRTYLVDRKVYKPRKSMEMEVSTRRQEDVLKTSV